MTVSSALISRWPALRALLVELPTVPSSCEITASMSMPSGRGHLVGNFGVRVHVLHVIELFKTLDQPQRLLRSTLVEKYGRFRYHSRLAAGNLNSPCFQPLAHRLKLPRIGEDVQHVAVHLN